MSGSTDEATFGSMGHTVIRRCSAQSNGQRKAAAPPPNRRAARHVGGGTTWQSRTDWLLPCASRVEVRGARFTYARRSRYDVRSPEAVTRAGRWSSRVWRPKGGTSSAGRSWVDHLRQGERFHRCDGRDSLGSASRRKLFVLAAKTTPPMSLPSSSCLCVRFFTQHVYSVHCMSTHRKYPHPPSVPTYSS